MSGSVLVNVEGVSKKFCRSLKRSLWYGMQDVTRELLAGTGDQDHLRKNEFWAVDDVSFKLRRGECLGLIGPNGAGKSTLLKILNGLIKPDRGRVTMRGRVGALIELGAGFNPILTGRENIYVNGSVLGFSKKEIDRKFDAIVEFSEIEKALDTPVQNYSSGMKVRLGFGVASQMEPDVLLIDEVLAVGDAAFRTKCFGQMALLAKNAAMIFVSHSMPLIGRMCSKAVLLEDGRRSIDHYDVPMNIAAYNELNQQATRFTQGEQNIQIRNISVRSDGVTSSGPTVELKRFSKVVIRFEFDLLRELGDFEINLVFLDQDQIGVAESFSSDHEYFVTARSGAASVEVEIPSLELNPGKYTLSLGLFEKTEDKTRGPVYFSQRGFFTLLVTGDSIGHAPVQIHCGWKDVQDR